MTPATQARRVFDAEPASAERAQSGEERGSA